MGQLEEAAKVLEEAEALYAYPSASEPPVGGKMSLTEIAERTEQKLNNSIV
jgi:hypothetical protein